MTGIRVHHLNCAHLRHMSLSGLQLACHVLLVETPASGLVLVDTGLGTADYAGISSRLGWGFAYGYTPGTPSSIPARCTGPGASARPGSGCSRRP
jgi:hypothetical protein